MLIVKPKHIKLEVSSILPSGKLHELPNTMPIRDFITHFYKIVGSK